MKRFLIILLFPLVNISMAHAQYGVAARVGLSLSTMIGVESSGSTRIIPDLGLVTGISGEFRLVEKESFTFYLQPEFALQQKGYATRYKSGSFWSRRNYNLDYVSLPVAAKLMFGSGRLKGGINIGIAPSLLIGRYNQYIDSDRDRERSVVNRSNVRLFDFNAFLGGVVEFELGPGALFADMRYTQGFLNPYVNNYIGSKTYLNAMPSFSIGYVFRIGSSNSGSVRSDGPSSVPSGYAPPVENTEPETADDWEDESPQETRPASIDREVEEPQTQQLRPAPTPRENTASTSSDFEEMIALNKHFDAVADVHASSTDKEVSKTEILSRFTNPDVLVKIAIDNVVVDYYSITQFIQYIRLNHFRYKITDRTKDDNGMISEIIMHRIG